MYDENAEEEDRRAAESEMLGGGLDPTKYAQGTYGFHEATHGTSIILDTFDRNILEHPAIVLDPDIYRLARKAHDALWELYQFLGAK